jgi:hypothetical protein
MSCFSVAALKNDLSFTTTTTVQKGTVQLDFLVAAYIVIAPLCTSNAKTVLN